mmetsp:Transcript_105243/g.166158  ORF Transcript_105243/g.166158 Transcript_105243/m.166158 type:complete len:231 (-) Transcript_105243:1322-2014(-)
MADSAPLKTGNATFAAVQATVAIVRHIQPTHTDKAMYNISAAGVWWNSRAVSSQVFCTSIVALVAFGLLLNFSRIFSSIDRIASKPVLAMSTAIPIGPRLAFPICHKGLITRSIKASCKIIFAIIHLNTIDMSRGDWMIGQPTYKTTLRINWSKTKLQLVATPVVMPVLVSASIRGCAPAATTPASIISNLYFHTVLPSERASDFALCINFPVPSSWIARKIKLLRTPDI